MASEEEKNRFGKRLTEGVREGDRGKQQRERESNVIEKRGRYRERRIKIWSNILNEQRRWFVQKEIVEKVERVEMKEYK